MKIQSTRARLLASSILCVTVFAAAGAAYAQEAGSVDEVIVTGSRIARQDYVASSPIVSVGEAAIEQTGDVTLERAFNQLPQIQITTGGQVNNGGNGQVTVALRGMQTVRTLVLVDGRRAVSSSSAGTIDLNTIPSALIENIEVITGGASAAYGSDAIAGVVNFKLKHNFQGVEMDAQYNITEKSDGEQTAFALTVGGNFADDRGNAVLSLGYDARQPVFYGARENIKDTGRPDGLTDPRILAVGGLSTAIPQGSYVVLPNAVVNAAGTGFTSASNTPTQAAVDAIFAKYGVAAGGVPIAANSGLGFNADGTLFYKGVNYKGPTGIDFSTIPTTGAAGTGATGPGAYNTGALNYALTPQTRYNAFASSRFELAPQATIYTQASFNQFEANTVLAPTPAASNPGTNLGAAATINTGFLVPVTNPYISADLRAILASRPNPTAPFLFNKRFSEVGSRNATIQYTTWQMLTGVSGDLTSNLSYDLFGSYGRTTRIDSQSGNISRVNMRQYLESPTGSFGGCTGYNPFGMNGITEACRNLISPVTKNVTQLSQRQVEGSVQGKLFDLPEMSGKTGGEVRFAVGADYRQDEFSIVPDSLASGTDTSGTIGSATNPYNNASAIAGFGAGQGLAGAIDVYELFGELLVPVLKDLPLIQSLDVGLGGRYSNYNFSGGGRQTGLNAVTYKVDLDWALVNWARVRGGYSRAIRAPNIGELYTPLQSNFASIGAAGSIGSGDPCDINGAYRKGQGVDAARITALCTAMGVPTNVINIFQGNSQQAPSTSGGNPLLHEEQADTYTIGLVLRSQSTNPMLSNLSASLDYYSIEVNDFITQIGLSTSLAKCYNSDGSNPTYSASNPFCLNILRDTGTGQISNGFANSQNAGALKTAGIDLQVDYAFGLSDLPLGLSESWGRLAFNTVITYLDDFSFQTSTADAPRQYKGSIGSAEFGYLPKWKALLNVTYGIGPVDLTVTERYIGDAQDQGCVGVTTCTARGVPATFYTNLTGRWKITDTLEARAGIDNLTDQIPRFFTSGSSSQAFSDATTYDFLGRRYFVALKARF